MSAGLNPTFVSSRRARRLSAKVGLLTPSLLYDLRAQLLALPHTDEVASVPLSFQTRLAGYLLWRAPERQPLCPCHGCAARALMAWRGNTGTACAL